MKPFFSILFCFLFFFASLTVCSAQWQPTYGPFAGMALQFSQNQDYAFVTGNGLYRSSNGGRSWNRLTILRQKMVKE
jgi:hypothetical protein